MRSDLTDLLLFEHHRTAAAVLVSDTGAEKDGVWLPLSQVEIEAKPTKAGGNEVIVTGPEWLFADKRLI